MTPGTAVPGDDAAHLLRYTAVPIGFVERVLEKDQRHRGLSNSSRGVLPPSEARRWRSTKSRRRVWRRVHAAFPPSRVPTLPGVEARARRHNATDASTLDRACRRCAQAEAGALDIGDVPPTTAWSCPTTLTATEGGRWVSQAWRWLVPRPGPCATPLPGTWEAISAQVYWEVVIKNAKWLVQEAGEAEASEDRMAATPGVLRAVAWLDAAWSAGEHSAHAASVLKDIGLCYYTLATTVAGGGNSAAVGSIIRSPVPPEHPCPGAVQSPECASAWYARAMRRAALVWGRYLDVVDRGTDKAVAAVAGALEYAVQVSSSEQDGAGFGNGGDPCAEPTRTTRRAPKSISTGHSATEATVEPDGNVGVGLDGPDRTESLAGADAEPAGQTTTTSASAGSAAGTNTRRRSRRRRRKSTLGAT